ncbi:TPA: XRE family transcriptional regulator [Enterococcus faecium]|nr:XRE family transcriptional regulator [Enterococcus faecium]NVN79644.1 XRE family transcriptional regulator [Enterococcus avium]MBG0381111.1 XRE family transcriptional regulator [Enterococcus faecium]MBJ1658672.1 XRE family transcriptional regulator [Enterococcus faecium]MBY3638710.1 XRE family transcriptional regulator [Enterococcus faecium]
MIRRVMKLDKQRLYEAVKDNCNCGGNRQLFKAMMVTVYRRLDGENAEAAVENAYFQVFGEHHSPEWDRAILDDMAEMHEKLWRALND